MRMRELVGVRRTRFEFQPRIPRIEVNPQIDDPRPLHVVK